jgi:tetratricopeptide (TPR) repeat protein
VRRLRPVTAAVVAGLLAFLPASRARAVDAATRTAKAHYDQAELAYRLGRFTAALAEYGLAYEAKRLPALLFNIAQCHKMLGSYEKAIFFYESFLRDTPDAPNRALVESLLAESRAALDGRKRAAEERKATAARAAADAADAERFRARRDSERAATAEAALRATVPTTPVAPRPVLQRWWFWTIVGAVAVGGAAAAGVAIAVPRVVTVLPAGSLGTLDRRE